MKKTIPFNLFGENQELCFTITGVAELEKKLGKSIHQIYNSQYAGVDFCLAALPIALKNIHPSLYEKKIEKYLTDEPGRRLDDIAVPIIHALLASGVYGKENLDRIMAIYYPELIKDKEPEQKNV